MSSDFIPIAVVHANIVLYAMSYWLTQPILPFLMKELSADTLFFARFQTFCSFLQLLGGPLAGRICDSFGFSVTLGISQVSACLSYILLSQSTTTALLFMSQLPTVLMHAMHAAQAATTIFAAKADRATAMGRLSLSYGIGMVLGSYFGGVLSKTYSNQHTAIVAAVLSASMLPINWYTFHGSQNQVVGGEKSSKASSIDIHKILIVARQPLVRHCMIVQFLLGVALSVYRTTFSEVLRQHIALDAQDIGLLMSVGGVASIISNGILLQFFLKRFRENAVIFGSIFCLATLFVVYAHLPQGSTSFTMMALIVPMSSVSAISYTVLSSQMSKGADDEDRATAIGISHATRSACGLIAPSVGAFLLQSHGLQYLGYSCALISLISLVFSSFGHQILATPPDKKIQYWRKFHFEPTARASRFVPSNVIVRFTMLRSKQQAKYSTFGGETNKKHPLKSASFLSKLFFTWCMPLVSKDHQLNIEDVWSLEDSNTAEVNSSRFAAAFSRKKSMIWAGIEVYGGLYFLTGIMGLSLRLLDLVSPIVLQKLVESSGDVSHLYYWLGVLLVAKLARSFMWVHCVMLEDLLCIRFVGGLKGVLFKKLLTKASVQDESDTPDLANAYTADMDALIWASISLHNLWILPTQVIIISYMLYQEIGLASFAGMGMIVSSLLAGGVVSTIQSKAYGDVSSARDERMQAIKETFGSILIVKLHAWEQKCREKIQSLRETELGFVWRLMSSGAVSIFILWAAPLFVSMTSFAVYSMVLHQPLTATKVFTSLALFRLLQTPVQEIPDNITAVVEARVSLQRILTFLTLREKPIRPAPTTEPDESTVISIQHGTFKWNEKDAAILKDISLTVSHGDLVVIHGKVGSGKSSLCMAILGEMVQTEGTTGVYGSIAYCSQEPWIQQMSVRDNILFGSQFDSRKYTQVVRACGLLPDFELMAFGDMTEVGSKGRNLSGGQKARISLARACYSDADIVILDAPLAAIDAVVQKQIMTECIETLLKTKTVILVTHNADIIGSDSVNHLVELDEGKLDHLVVTPSEAVASHSSVNLHHESTPRAKTLSAGFLSPRVMEAKCKWSQHFELAMAEETSDEERAEGQVDFSVYSTFISACGGAPTVIAICIIQTFWQAFQIASDVWLGHWTSSPDAAENTNWYIGIYSALCFGSVVMVLCRTLTVAASGLKASRYLFDKMTSSLLCAPMAFYDANPIGRIVNRYAEDTASIDTRLPYSYGGLTAMAFAVAGSLLTSMAVVKWCGLLFLPILYMYYRLAQMYLRPSRELSRLMNVTNSPVLSFLDEVENGFSLIRGYGSKYINEAIDRHAHHVNLNHQMWYAKVALDMWFELCIQLQGTAIVMIVATGLVMLRSVLSAGMVGLAFNYILMADANIVDVVKTYSWLEIGMVAPERVLQYCDLENEDPTAPKKAIALKDGAIEFKNVQFKYKPTGELILQDLTCSIRGGEKIGIVGRTGAGKSSLTMVLFRMYPILSGSISIDGQDISTVSKQELRRHLSIIPQSPVLFKGTLRQYLDPFGSFDDAALWSVVSKAGLHTLVSEMPEKLSTEIADKGSNLSVGERQMLCLARALLVQSKIVVLDEATAAMDHETDVRLQAVISTEFANATVLTIAHRLHTIMHSDRIMVMDAGRVVEMDTPAVLLAKEGGVFQRLAKDGGVIDP